jgi:hypothetical protein
LKLRKNEKLRREVWQEFTGLLDCFENWRLFEKYLPSYLRRNIWKWNQHKYYLNKEIQMETLN